ncbi:MAG: hypothetical protein ACON47_02840 [Flavobacteriaceae bacterium]
MFRGNPFKTQKNRRYNYTPRYYKGKEEGNPYDFDSKFSRFRETYNANDFGHQWKDAREKMRHRGNRSISPLLLLLIGLLSLLALYVLDFDWTLFTQFN